MYVLSADIDLTKGMTSMTRKNYSMIIVLAAITIIPQLLFWWLAPSSATAHLAVYIGGTILTVGVPASYLLTYWNSNIRRTSGLLIVFSVLQIVTIIISILLLWVNATVRSTVFVFVITSLVYLIVLMPMISSVLKPQIEGVTPVGVSEEHGNQSTDNFRRQDGVDMMENDSDISQISNHVSATRLLPPRKRQ